MVAASSQTSKPPEWVKRDMNGAVSSILWRAKNRPAVHAYEEIKRFEGKFDEMVSLYFERLLKHARKTVPYYQDIQLVGLDNIHKIPILTKNDIRCNSEGLLSSEAGRYRSWNNTSGGSTGEPVRFVQDTEYQRWVDASLYYYFEDLVDRSWVGSRKINIWGSVSDLEKKSFELRARVKNWLTNTHVINSFRFGDEEMRHAVQRINCVQPDILKGYANSLYDLAKFISENGHQVRSTPIINTCTAMLYPEQRALIENVFQGRVFDFYGSRETGAIAGESKEHDGKCVFEFNNIVEVVDGDVLVTNLHNYTMPLIRYKIQDRAERIERRGRALPVLHGLSGREFDHFQIGDGRRLHVQYVITLFFYLDELVSFQVVQKSLTDFVVQYVTRAGEDISETKRREIESKMKAAMRDDIVVQWMKVPEIMKTANGKHAYAKCEIEA